MHQVELRHVYDVPGAVEYILYLFQKHKIIERVQILFDFKVYQKIKYSAQTECI